MKGNGGTGEVESGEGLVKIVLSKETRCRLCECSLAERPVVKPDRSRGVRAKGPHLLRA